MSNKNSSAGAWKFSDAVRNSLEALLPDGSANSPQPALTSRQALQALNEARTAYLAGDELQKQKRGGAPTPANSVRLIDRALHALGALEAGGDADTLQVSRPHLEALRAGLKDRRDVLEAWRIARQGKMTTDDGLPVRKTDARTEPMRVLCGYVGRIWQSAAVDPIDRTKRRRFAITFLDAAGIPHPGDKHPAMLDKWLDTPVGPMQPGLHEAAAAQAHAVLNSLSKLAPK